jgi:hypothetical protein
LGEKLSRASIASPREGTFFRQRCNARIRDHLPMMVGGGKAVNGANDDAARQTPARKKKAGLKRARLKVLAT